MRNTLWSIFYALAIVGLGVAVYDFWIDTVTVWTKIILSFAAIHMVKDWIKSYIVKVN